MKVCVIGAGVNGIGCAIKIKEEFPHLEVVVLTKDVTPNTTGDGSAGLWGPYLIGDTPQHKVKSWSGETHSLFLSLWRQGVAGACLLPMLRVQDQLDTDILPCWKDNVLGFQNLKEEQLKLWNQILSANYKSAYLFTSLTCEPTLLLPYLMQRFTAAGGRVEKRQVTSLQELVDEGVWDIVVNCAGLAAKDIVPDGAVKPIRGQVARVEAPWMYYVLLDDSDNGNYIIPNMKSVVLGGTHQENDYNLDVCPEDRKFIFDGCQRLVPALKNAPTTFEWVGLRPGRNSVRLEREDVSCSHGGSCEVPVIHNYGHGGSGVTLFWGCATDVVNILRNIITERKAKL